MLRLLLLSLLATSLVSGQKGHGEAESGVHLFAKALVACDPSGSVAVPGHLDCIVEKVVCTRKPRPIRSGEEPFISAMAGGPVRGGGACESAPQSSAQTSVRCHSTVAAQGCTCAEAAKDSFAKIETTAVGS